MAGNSASPEYDLSKVKDLVRRARYSVSRKAQKTARDAFSMTWGDIGEAILQLTRTGFYKSMPSVAYEGEVMDVYRLRCDDGTTLRIYIKFHINGDNFIRITSFKPHNSKLH